MVAVPSLSHATHDIPLALIDESPTNPRKTFRGVDELAINVAEHGVLEPVLCRPKGKRYELVFGARRYRAAVKAGLKTIPSTVREIDDAKVLEIQIIENSQRSDIHPLEEADGYQALFEKHGYTVDEIAAKVGKSRATVAGRLKYCTLIPEARKAFLEDKLSAATALIVARIPHADLQKKALQEIVRESYDGQPCTAREASRVVKQKFMLRIVDAQFDTKDAALVVGAPACGPCPKRTANQRELFEDLDPKDDLCTDPKCFGAKRDAAWKKRVEAAKSADQKVLADKEAKKLFDSYRHEVRSDAGYVDLDANDWSTGKPFRLQLGKAAKDITPILARDETGKVHELVPRAEFAKAVPKSAPAAQQAKEDEKIKAQQEADRKRHERERAKQQQAIVDIVTAAERRQPTDAFWRTLAIQIATTISWEIDGVLERRGIGVDEKAAFEDLEKTGRTAIAKLTGAQARGFAVELLLGDHYGQADAIKEFQGVYGAKPKSKPAPKPTKAKAAPKKKAARK